MTKLVIIDGNALVHRAFHALPPTLNSSKGVPTNAVFGFTSVLIKMIKDIKPDYITATFDLAAPTFRHEEFAEYKIHREKAPDELYAQIPLVKEILMAFGIPVYEKPGFEADDLIGALADKAKQNKDLQVVIMTGDLDTLQLIEGKKVVVFTLRKGVTDTVIYDEGEVEKRYNLKPNQLNDFKGLKGDPSDNIPGVPGVGEKTASALMQKFGSLDKLYEFLSAFNLPAGEPLSKKDKAKIKPPLSEKLIQKLIENKDMAFFSKKLATIIRDIDLEFSLDKSDWRKNINQPEVEKLFKELGLYSLVKRLGDIGLVKQEQMALMGEFYEEKEGRKISDLKNKKDISDALGRIKKNKEIIFSIGDEFLNFVLDGQPYSVAWPLLVGNGELFKEIEFLFESPDITKVSYDLKDVAKFILGYGIELNGPAFDTKLAAYLLNSDRKDYGLDKIYFDEFNENMDGDKRTAPFFISNLRKKQSEKLKKENLGWLFDNIEVPTARILAEMELRGILIDSKSIVNLSKSISTGLAGLEKKIYKLAGAEFNINSPQQLSEILFEKLELKGKVRKTGKGARSTAAPELEKLSTEHPIIDFILKYRELQKLKTTYVDPFPALINKTSGRLHTTFNQTGTTTGRLASQDPNLQNIPIRTELGQEFRKVFIASSGYKLVSFDYSQIELRVAAHITQDKKMIEAFRGGEDIHTRTAAEIFSVKPEDVTANMRRDAKVLNFGILYGMGILGFQRASGVSREKAREFIDRYMKEFPGIAKYMNEMKMKARKDGYVSTVFGRRRWFPDIRSSMPQIVSQAERMAINHPIQGTATGDLMKLAMIKAFEYTHKSNPDDIFLLLQVHDELLFEIKDSLVKKVSKEIKNIMESVYKFEVPLIVDVKYGDNWAELKVL